MRYANIIRSVQLKPILMRWRYKGQYRFITDKDFIDKDFLYIRDFTDKDIIFFMDNAIFTDRP